VGKHYQQGRADAAAGKNSPPAPDIVDHFLGYNADEMAKNRAEYKEGHADKIRELKKK
jgi:hypothetical protein